MIYGIVLLSLWYLLTNLILTTALMSGFRGTVGARIGITIVSVLLAFPILIVILIILIPREVLKHGNKQ